VRRASAVLLPVSLAAALAACDGDAGRTRGDAAGDPASAAEGRMDADADSGGVPLYPLRLVNPRFYPIVVFASAGAREVLVDTVAARDSSRLNVQVAAGLLRLRAVDLEGNQLGVAVLSLSRGDPPGGVEGGAERGVDSLSWELAPPP